jgi:hypothetical protein
MLREKIDESPEAVVLPPVVAANNDAPPPNIVEVAVIAGTSV